MEIVFKNYKIKNKDYSFSIKDNKITGITGKNRHQLMEIIWLKNNYQGEIIIDNKKIESKDINKYKKKISIIREENKERWFHNTIYENMYYEIRRKNLCLKNPKKKILDSLKIVGLNQSYIEKNINTLSTSEKKCIDLAISLLSNPELIMIEEPFKSLDKNREKKMILLLQKIKEQYNKTIIFVSSDSNMLYKYTDYLIIGNKQSLIEGKTEEIYQDINILKKHKIAIPEIVEFTYLARKNKKAKIEYHKDIRDIIKDIYKHV